jgi:hypothetical protein
VVLVILQNAESVDFVQRKGTLSARVELLSGIGPAKRADGSLCGKPSDSLKLANIERSAFERLAERSAERFNGVIEAGSLEFVLWRTTETPSDRVGVQLHHYAISDVFVERHIDAAHQRSHRRDCWR